MTKDRIALLAVAVASVGFALFQTVNAAPPPKVVGVSISAVSPPGPGNSAAWVLAADGRVKYCIGNFGDPNTAACSSWRD